MLSRPRSTCLALALAVATPVLGSAQEVVKGPTGARLDILLSTLEDRGFSGTVLVAKRGEVVLHKGYGLANRDLKRRAALDTVYDIGSITKQFTAAAILKLETLGKLKTDDLLSRHLAGVPADKAGITLHHLLTHTAAFDGAYGEDDDYLPSDLAVRLFLRMPLLRAPGVSYSYSNPGYSLLAAVVEKASGQPYEAFLRDQLFRPAGMEQTGYILPRWNLDLVSHNYDAKDEGHGNTFNRNWGPDGPYWNLFGNGGILSTTGDFLKWEQALLGEKVLPAAIARRLWTPHVRDGDDRHYGYGWAISKTARGTTRVGHGGGSSWGVSCQYQRFPEDGILVVAFSNTAGGNRGDLSGRLAAMALAE